MAEIELLPCPFCGSDASIVSVWRKHWVWCGRCKAETNMAGSVEDAARLWNRRAFGQEVRLEGDTLYFEGLGTFKRVSQ